MTDSGSSNSGNSNSNENGGKGIDYAKLMEFLGDISLFEMYRITLALRHELTNPERIATVRAGFKEGDVIEYFCERTNQYVKAVVQKKNSRYVDVINCDDKQRWEIAYSHIKIDSRDLIFNRNSNAGLTKNTLRIGDWVGFNHDGKEIIGCIERLNHKTVSLVTADKRRWRVSYRFLYAVIEGEGRQHQHPQQQHQHSQQDDVAGRRLTHMPYNISASDIVDGEIIEG